MFLSLGKKYHEARVEYTKAAEKLKEGYFSEVNSLIKRVEKNRKNEFCILMDDNMKDSLLKFKVNYDPANTRFSLEVSEMAINGTYHDLNYWAEQVEESERTHESLIQTHPTYRGVFERMEKELISLSLHPSSRPSRNNNIEKFFKDNHILGITPKFREL